MHVQVLLLDFFERGVPNAASFLRILIALVVPVVGFRLLIVARKNFFTPARSTLSDQVQQPHNFPTFIKHGLSLQRLRKSATTSSILRLRFWKACHDIVYTPSQISTFANLRSSTIDYTSIKWRIFQSVFGIPSQYYEAYKTASEELDMWVAKCLMKEPWMGEMIQTAIANTQWNIGTLVTFTEAEDELKLVAWEQHASPRRMIGTKGRPNFCEVSLYPLLTEFLGSMTLPAMMGKAFLAQSPTVLEDIDMLDDSFALMALGLPRWLPIPSLRNAYHARDRLHDALERLYISLAMVSEGKDPGPAWRDLSDVSYLIKGYDQLWKKAGFPVRARAAAGLSMPWALTINGNNVFFWLLLRIHATPRLADEIRQQTRAFFVQAKDGQGALRFENIPGANDMGRRCPLLKACYLETIRLDGEIRSIRKVRGEHLIATSDSRDARPSHMLRPGDYIHALHYLHHSDPRYFADPQVFKPERFLTPGDKAEVDPGTLRPYGAGISMCKGRVIAERVILYAVAACLHTWNMEPGSEAGEWKIPDHVSAAGVCKPRQDVRVLLSRRNVQD